MKSFLLLGICALSAFAQQPITAYIDSEAQKLQPLGYISTYDDTIPHIAFGGAWTTKITLVNYRQETLIIPVSFTDDFGTPLAVPLGGTSYTSTLVRLGPLAMATIETDYLPNAKEKSGIARLAIPCSSVDSCGNVGGFATFKWRIPYKPDQEAAVQLAPSREHRTFIVFDETMGYFTGIAIAHPKYTSTSAATINVIGRDANANQIMSDQLTVPADGHLSFLVYAKWPRLANNRGTIELTTTDYVAATALVFNSTGAFSTSPSFAVSQ
jgi:hypothetical protein